MKRWVKRLFKALWRAGSPVRRPIMRKFEGELFRVNEAVVRREILPRLSDGFESTVNAAHHAAHALSADLNLVLNSVVRELARLQMQVEVLQQMVEDQARPRGRLFIADEDETEEISSSHGRNGDERMKVG